MIPSNGIPRLPMADDSNCDRSEPNMRKRVKQTIVGTMEAARTIKRSFPATRSQQARINKSKEVACGANPTRFTSLEVYHPTSLGHSASRELFGNPAASWLEERGPVGMQGGEGSRVPQWIGHHDAESNRRKRTL